MLRKMDEISKLKGMLREMNKKINDKVMIETSLDRPGHWTKEGFEQVKIDTEDKDGEVYCGICGVDSDGDSEREEGGSSG